MTSYAFWEHTRSGELFAVRIDPDGIVTGMVHPVPHDERDERNLPAFHFDDVEHRIEPFRADSATEYREVLPIDERITLYAIAEMRVEREPDLLPHREVILHESPEGDEHWNWVIDAPVEEIVEWARTVENEGA
jgi:hypothetical protein